MDPTAPDPQGYVTDVAYLPGTYPFMAPDRMRYVAALNGIAPPAVRDGFRYLELGCGFGSTLLALAAANPHGRFVGVDFMPVHTDALRAEAAAAGLDNLEVLCADFAAMPDDLPDFDFIVMHGVFSWVSGDLRNHVLDIVARHLAADGIVEVSYNTLPGWSSLLPVRSLLRHFATRATGDSLAKARAALEAVTALRKADIPVFHDQPLASQLVDRLLLADPRYVAHEYLNEHWTAFESGDVIRMFAAHGIGYAGRIPVYRNHLAFSVQPRFAAQFVGLDDADRESLKDLHDNTMFRWDLYARTPRREWTPRQRAAAADDIWFRVASPTASLPHTVVYGPITAGLAGPPHDRMLEIMGLSSWTLDMLLDAPGLSHLTPEAIVEAVDDAVAMGLFRVDGGPVLDGVADGGTLAAGPLAIPDTFNRRMIGRQELLNTKVGLASLRTGGPHDVGDLHAMALEELVARGREGLETRLVERLAALDKHLREHATGRLLSAAECQTAMGEIVTEFLTKVLPELVRLGIVASPA